MMGGGNDNALLEVTGLSVDIEVRKERLPIIIDASFALLHGETLGIVGESGAGKSMLGNAVAGLLEPPLSVSRGRIEVLGRRIDTLSGEAARRLRGKTISMIFQDPLTSLDPLFTISDQIVETICTHLKVDRAEARERGIALLEATGIPAARERFDDYPHQFSGGMRQRVVIALALCAEPKLVIADEPTTALDVSVQAQIIRLLGKLCKDHGTSVILITHDMGVIAEATDRVAVMYAGRIVEIGPTWEVIRNPRHPYTRGLMASIPPLDRRPERLAQIEGAMPRIGAAGAGCAFHPRCPVALTKCAGELPPLRGDDGHAAACWLGSEQL